MGWSSRPKGMWAPMALKTLYCRAVLREEGVRRKESSRCCCFPPMTTSTAYKGIDACTSPPDPCAPYSQTVVRRVLELISTSGTEDVQAERRLSGIVDAAPEQCTGDPMFSRNVILPTVKLQVHVHSTASTRAPPLHTSTRRQHQHVSPPTDRRVSQGANV